MFIFKTVHVFIRYCFLISSCMDICPIDNELSYEVDEVTFPVCQLLFRSLFLVCELYYIMQMDIWFPSHVTPVVSGDEVYASLRVAPPRKQTVLHTLCNFTMNQLTCFSWVRYMCPLIFICSSPENNSDFPLIKINSLLFITSIY